MWIQLKGRLYNLDKVCMITKAMLADINKNDEFCYELKFYYTNHEKDTECVYFHDESERNRVFNLIGGLIATDESFFNFDAE